MTTTMMKHDKTKGNNNTTTTTPTTCKASSTRSSSFSAGPSIRIPTLRPEDVELEQVLGEGASAAVYSGSCFQVPVAVKVINTKRFGCDSNIRRFKREARIMAQLKHPNICELYGKVKTGSHKCLIMQLAEGGDLLARLQRHGALPEVDARRLFSQLVSALSYMHAKGFVHRDIKPENLFLDARGNLVLGDFGFANSWSPYTYQQDFCGSLHYAAPEVILHGLVQGPEADVWSCGAVLLAFVTARLPFEGKSHAHIVKRIKKGKFAKSPVPLSSALLDLLKKMMEPSPMKRITLKEVMQHPWLQVPPTVDNIPPHRLNRSGSLMDTDETTPTTSSNASGEATTLRMPGPASSASTTTSSSDSSSAKHNNSATTTTATATTTSTTSTTAACAGGSNRCNVELKPLNLEDAKGSRIMDDMDVSPKLERSYSNC